ncbi:hypothetical protein PIB30_012002 [Stylosanthes scabra]|uniref:Alpha-L-arabinofuranosidase 1 catalytic domain-containing protein n=1 Tax=Stylosanthes scabra TaxID=79078 RepID=A0ABU6Y4S1_9FABA|nr:hypothetical protein [Stylosanthes scabra]
MGQLAFQLPTCIELCSPEINHAGAGGLWAELVSNRGFEAGGTQVPSNIKPWTIVGEESSILVQTELNSCFERNKNIEKGKKYKVAFHVRSEGPINITVSFKDAQGGGILASSNIQDSASEVSNWKRMETTLEANGSSANSTIQLTTTKKGVLWLDQVSAMPLDTFKGHGFRKDLMKMLIELKPAFIRFPGQRLRNAFRWKDSVGPWEQRPGHFGDVWSYWTDDALGYFEALQLAEDIGAKPIWVFNNGISHTDEVDTSAIKPFVQKCRAILLAQTAITKAAKRPGAPSPVRRIVVRLHTEMCAHKEYPLPWIYHATPNSRGKRSALGA